MNRLVCSAAAALVLAACGADHPIGSTEAAVREAAERPPAVARTPGEQTGVERRLGAQTGVEQRVGELIGVEPRVGGLRGVERTLGEQAAVHSPGDRPARTVRPLDAVAASERAGPPPMGGGQSGTSLAGFLQPLVAAEADRNEPLNVDGFAPPLIDDADPETLPW